jgi:hypothetical protein
MGKRVCCIAYPRGSDSCGSSSPDPSQQLGRVRLENAGEHAGVHVLALTLGLHQSRLDQLFQVVRDRGLRHRELLAELLVWAPVVGGDGGEQREASWIGECFGDPLELSGGELPASTAPLVHGYITIEL